MPPSVISKPPYSGDQYSITWLLGAKTTYKEVVRAQRSCTIATSAPPAHQLTCEWGTTQEKAEESYWGRIGKGTSQITLDSFLRCQVELLEQLFRNSQQESGF